MNSRLDRTASTTGSPARLGARVVCDIIGAIVGGQFASGSLLPPENDLAMQFGVSRAVVRESVKIVEEKGLLGVSQGRGTIVKAEHEWNVLDEVVLATIVDRRDSLRVLDELASVRREIEPRMAFAAASARTPARSAELAKSCSLFLGANDDVEAFLFAETSFHEVVMEQSGDLLTARIARILLRVANGTHVAMQINRESIRLDVEELLTVFAAIERGDSAAASAVMKQHLGQSWGRRRPRD